MNYCSFKSAARVSENVSRYMYAQLRLKESAVRTNTINSN